MSDPNTAHASGARGAGSASHGRTSNPRASDSANHAARAACADIIDLIGDEGELTPVHVHLSRDLADAPGSVTETPRATRGAPSLEMEPLTVPNSSRALPSARDVGSITPKTLIFDAEEQKGEEGEEDIVIADGMKNSQNCCGPGLGATLVSAAMDSCERRERDSQSFFDDVLQFEAQTAPSQSRPRGNTDESVKNTQLQRPPSYEVNPDNEPCNAPSEQIEDGAWSRMQGNDTEAVSMELHDEDFVIEQLTAPPGSQLEAPTGSKPKHSKVAMIPEGVEIQFEPLTQPSEPDPSPIKAVRPSVGKKRTAEMQEVDAETPPFIGDLPARVSKAARLEHDASRSLHDQGFSVERRRSRRRAVSSAFRFEEIFIRPELEDARPPTSGIRRPHSTAQGSLTWMNRVKSGYIGARSPSLSPGPTGSDGMKADTDPVVQDEALPDTIPYSPSPGTYRILAQGNCRSKSVPQLNEGSGLRVPKSIITRKYSKEETILGTYDDQNLNVKTSSSESAPSLSDGFVPPAPKMIITRKFPKQKAIVVSDDSDSSGAEIDPLSPPRRSQRLAESDTLKDTLRRSSRGPKPKFTKSGAVAIAGIPLSDDESPPRPSRQRQLSVRRSVDSSSSDEITPIHRRRKRSRIRQDSIDDYLVEEQDDDISSLKEGRRPSRKRRRTVNLEELMMPSNDEVQPSDACLRLRQNNVRLSKRQAKRSKARRKPRRSRRYDDDEDFIVNTSASSSNSDFSRESPKSPPSPGDSSDAGSGDVEDDSHSASSSGEAEPIGALWETRRAAVRRALRNNSAPFRAPIICAICEWRGSPALGTMQNGWRDGYVQPASNFSDAVQRGDYGMRMTKPFCLGHTAGDQNGYVRRLQSTARDNVRGLGPEARDDGRRSKKKSSYKQSHFAPPRQNDVEHSDGWRNRYDEESSSSDDDFIVQDSADDKVAVEVAAARQVVCDVEPVFLDVPRGDLDVVRGLGAKLDWKTRRHFVPPGVNIAPFQKWIEK